MPMVSRSRKEIMTKRQHEGLFSDKTILCIDCSGGFMNPYALKLYIKTVQKLDGSFQSSLSIFFQLLLSTGN